MLDALGPLAEEWLALVQDSEIPPYEGPKVLIDPAPHAGVLPASVYGLHAASGEVCMIVAGDMPFVQRLAFEYLLRVQRAERASVVIPRVDGFLQPMHAMVNRQVALEAIQVGQEHWATKPTPDGDVQLFVWRKPPPDNDAGRGAILFVHGSSMGSVPSFDLQVPGRPGMSAMDHFAQLGYDTWTFDHEGYRRSLAEEDSVPNGTYIDMCRNLPVVDPARIVVPTIVLRGQFDGIAGFGDLIEFFERLPNPDKQFAVLPGIAHGSLTQKNHRIVQHIVEAFFGQPDPAYRGD